MANIDHDNIVKLVIGHIVNRDNKAIALDHKMAMCVIATILATHAPDESSLLDGLDLTIKGIRQLTADCFTEVQQSRRKET